MYQALAQLRVADAMHLGLISCSLDTPLRIVARMMATHRVHAILVTAHGEEELPGDGRWGVVFDVDLLRAAQAASLDDQPARAVVTSPALTVSTEDALADAAQLMLDRAVSHVIALEPQTARPIGVLSTLDIARALAGFPERHPLTH